MPEAINLLERTEPQVRNLVNTYINRTPIIKHIYGNYLEEKKAERTGMKVNLVLKTSGYIGTSTNSKKRDKKDAKLIRKLADESLVVEDFETQRSPIYKPLYQNIEGPYTVRENDPARIQKVIYNGKEIFFGITKENHLVMYSVVEQNGKRQMVVHTVEEIYEHQNNTAYLKNRARKTLLELLKRDYNLLPVKTSFVEVREAA